MRRRACIGVRNRLSDAVHLISRVDDFTCRKLWWAPQKASNRFEEQGLIMSGAARLVDGRAALDFDSRGDEAQGFESRAEASARGESTLKHVVAERLAAHRANRAAARQQLTDLTAQKMREIEAGRGSSKVRDAVAARYQQSPSYREFLAAEAERALEQAQAEAEIAARNARAVADAKVQLFEELEHWERNAGPDAHDNLSQSADKDAVRGELAYALADIALGAQELIREGEFEAAQLEAAKLGTMQPEAVGLRVQFEEAVATTQPSAVRQNMMRQNMARQSVSAEQALEDELAALEAEIDFRRAPELTDYQIATQIIPANIIEFPRQLVAPKKARPRLAEGPLREEAPQLRIFEVDAEQVSDEPAAQTTASPDWQSMKLEATAAAPAAVPQYAQTQFTLQPQTASIARRTMAAAVDAICIGAAFVAFVAAAAEIMGSSVRLLPRPLLGLAAAAVLFTLYLAYELLFISLNGDTPGMRYARIGLCTFGDRNPTRKAMRRRIFATMLAVFPVGLGLLWACLDDERLGWHDRMSRMYQRSY
jgi:uncharacterized RDD family membrane protein YckC